MANFYSGQDGQLIVDGQTAAKVRSWSFTASQAVLETVSLEDKDRTLIPGLRSITGSCSIYYYADGGSNTAAGGVSTFLGKFVKPSGSTTEGATSSVSSDSATLKLKVNDGVGNGRFIELNVYITSLAMTNAVGQILAADISFEANGAPVGTALAM